MGLPKPKHLIRHKDIVRLLFKYGRSDLIGQAELSDAFADEERPETEAEASTAEELAEDLEKLGPTYVKLGQLLSTRADLLPIPYLEALSRLQDRCEPFPFADVERIVQEELGVRISKAFTDFEVKPIAAASLGQVHRASLRNGQRVAVKVQRPDIRQLIVDDLAAFEEIADFLTDRTDWGARYNLAGLVEEFRGSMIRELSYRREADNMIRIHRNLANIELVVVPLPIEDYTTDRVLTMDFIQGRKITAIGPLGRLELDGESLVDALFEAYLRQVLVDGFFHADPHPGNIFLTDDHRIALIDLGMVAHLPAELRDQLLRLLLAVSEGRGDEAAEVAFKIGSSRENGLDREAFSREISSLVAEHQGKPVAEIETGAVILQISRTAVDNGVRLPRELTMLGKALLNLDAVGRALAPDFDPNAAIRRKAAGIASQQMRAGLSPSRILSSVLESAEFAQKLPGRINHILDGLTKNQLRLNVDVIDEATLVEGFQKVANRIAAGLVVAAFIVGAAMLMGVETDFQIFGYPGLAMLCFAGAVAAGIFLLYDILAHDRRQAAGKRP